MYEDRERERASVSESESSITFLKNSLILRERERKPLHTIHFFTPYKKHIYYFFFRNITSILFRTDRTIAFLYFLSLAITVKKKKRINKFQFLDQHFFI